MKVHNKKKFSNAYHKILNTISTNLSLISFQIADYKISTAIWDYPTPKKAKESLLIENMDYETSLGRNPIQNGS